VTEYCTRAEVLARLTTYGYAYATDRDELDGVVSATEEARYVDSAIAWAGTLLDELVAGFIDPASARGQQNQWLRDRAIDLTAWRCLSAGGRDVPASMQLSYQSAIDAMDRVRDGAKIPGLILSRPYGSPHPYAGGQRWPRAVNPS
jgi:hypothetical protein